MFYSILRLSHSESIFRFFFPFLRAFDFTF